MPPELDSGNCKKSKKRRKQLQLEERFTEEIGVKLENAAKDDNFNQDFLHADSKKDVPATNGGQEEQIDKLVSDLVCFSVFVNIFPNYLFPIINETKARKGG